MPSYEITKRHFQRGCVSEPPSMSNELLQFRKKYRLVCFPCNNYSVTECEEIRAWIKESDLPGEIWAGVGAKRHPRLSSQRRASSNSPPLSPLMLYIAQSLQSCDQNSKLSWWLQNCSRATISTGEWRLVLELISSKQCSLVDEDPLVFIAEYYSSISERYSIRSFYLLWVIWWLRLMTLM